jgi:hypothetical protein
VAYDDEVEVSPVLLQALTSGAPQIFEKDQDLWKEIEDIESRLHSAVRVLLRLQKYTFGNLDLAENLFSVRSVVWSKDGECWQSVPARLHAFVQVRYIPELNQTRAKALQRALDAGTEPFIALQHLHRAQTESSPRHRWIEATIAAELAIKEFLIRLKPEIATLLLEVPSPPLHKMYGSVLESMTGKRSPKVKSISKGAEIRNFLLHRPSEIDITVEKAEEYVLDVAAAIYHLLGILYPDDPWIQELADPPIKVSRT